MRLSKPTADVPPVVPLSSLPPKRSWRNYILDPRFQFKYSGMVVLVTVAVATVLGVLAYQYSKGQTELLTQQMVVTGDGSEESMKDIAAYAHQADLKVLLLIAGGVILMALVLGVTGILITHRVVGPVYKLKRLLRRVADGHLHMEGRLRKHDELQDLFASFESMVLSLRAHQLHEIAQLDAVIAAARKHGGTPESILAELDAFRDRMQRALD